MSENKEIIELRKEVALLKEKLDGISYYLQGISSESYWKYFESLDFRKLANYYSINYDFLIKRAIETEKEAIELFELKYKNK